MYDAKQPCRYQVGAGATTSLTATGVDAKSLMFYEPSRVWRLLFYVTTATVSTVSIVVRFYYRPVAGSSSGQVTLGSITIPTAIAADKVYYYDVTPYNMPAMSQVAFEVITAAAGGGAAGAGYWDVVSDFDPETALNSSKMVASA